MSKRIPSAALIAVHLLSTWTLSAATGSADLSQRFATVVQPFLKTYCSQCHSGDAPEAELNLAKFTSLESVLGDYPHWMLVLERLTAKEMPPKEAKFQPPAAERQRVIDWITAVRRNEINKNAGDPGLVLARRLSKAEYDYTIQDLTGVDIRPAREFPVDPANQAGFDNSGESLTMSPSLMAKYLQAARDVSAHMVLTPEGFRFAPHTMLVETDRDKYAIQRIVDFYTRQPTDFADYFQAAWRYKYRAALGKPMTTLAGFAASAKISPKYLPMVWQILEQTKEEVGPLVKLQAMWRALPVPKGNQPDLARHGTIQMRDFVVKIRAHTGTLISAPTAPGMNNNSQPLVTWRNRELSIKHRDFDRTALRVEGEPLGPEPVVTRGPTFGGSEVEALKVAVAKYIKDRQEDSDLVVPAGQRARYEAAFGRFSSVFPDKFYLKERGRFYPIESLDEGRYLGAGLHSLAGFFRDDITLIDMILDARGKKEIDTLWEEFEFIADYSARTFLQSNFNASFIGRGPAAATVAADGPVAFKEFTELTSEKSVVGIRDQFLSRAAAANNPVINEAIKYHFETMNSGIRWAEKARHDAEPRHLEALVKFAARAYRRPLEKGEREEILAYYRELREKSSLNHEDAMRASIVSVLVSPDFCYRIDLVDAAPGVAKAAVARGRMPLSGHALANRISYFLWSSMPDDELIAHATAGDLGTPAVLNSQIRRMLKDPRSRRLATEFAGNWLDFRRFETNNSVDRERFPHFTNQLREAMFEEPIRLIEDVIRNNRPVLDLLYAKHTFVNPVLAEHYGMPAVAGGQDHWVRVDNAQDFERGGLLPMGVFLTQNSPGLRTSPVKRGYWVVRRVLGEVIPPPPPNVPELPNDEAKMDLPLRDMLAQHRQNPACAVCHARFDTFGLALEGYGPIGEKRTTDLAGRAVDTKASFPRGVEGSGLKGLQSYIRTHREKDFLSSLCEKMLVYALGRSPLPTDEPLLEKMRMNLAAGGYRPSALIETLVGSPQFLNRRNQETKTVAQKGD